MNRRFNKPKLERFSRRVRFKSFWNYARHDNPVVGHHRGQWKCTHHRKNIVDGKECLEFDYSNKKLHFRGSFEGRDRVIPTTLKMAFRLVPKGNTCRIEARVKGVEAEYEIPERRVLEYNKQGVIREARYIAKKLGFADFESIEISFPEKPKLPQANN